jgi:hypothetical protein
MPLNSPMPVDPAAVGCSDRARPMDIPATPEALFEALAEPSLREVFPAYDKLKPRNQKMVKLLHTELTKGELSDAAFLEFTAFITVLWRQFNGAALAARQHQIETEDEIDTDWVDAAVHLARMDQFLNALLSQMESMPGQDGESGERCCDSQYLLMGPGD